MNATAYRRLPARGAGRGSATPSPRQAAILGLIVDSVARLGAPPTFREIGRAFGIASPNGVWCHLRALAKKGYITQPDHTNARSVRVLKLPDGTPVHGWAPITTTEDHQ